MQASAMNVDNKTMADQAMTEDAELGKTLKHLSELMEDGEAVKLIDFPNLGIHEQETMAQLCRRIRDLEHRVDLLEDQLLAERQRALVDPLSNIPNRRALGAQTVSEIARSRRSGAPLALIVWDIDRFKSINDNHGHQFGDKVIARVAREIQSRLRDSDFTARYGGEEFVSLLPDCDLEDAGNLAEEIRQVIRKIDFESGNGTVGITISCGIAAVQSEDDPDTLFARADRALFSAKTRGRNRVVTETFGR